MRRVGEVLSIGSDDVIRVKSAATEADMSWWRLTLPDRRSAAATLLREGVPGDHALVAFFLLAEGDEEGARKYLAKAGELAEAVLDSFTAPGKATTEATEGQTAAWDGPPPRRVAQTLTTRVERGGEGAGRPSPDRGPAVLYKAAEGAFVGGDVEKAKELFRSIVDGHPGTDYARKAAEFLEVLQ